MIFLQDQVSHAESSESEGDDGKDDPGEIPSAGEKTEKKIDGDAQREDKGRRRDDGFSDFFVFQYRQGRLLSFGQPVDRIADKSQRDDQADGKTDKKNQQRRRDIFIDRIFQSDNRYCPEKVQQDARADQNGVFRDESFQTALKFRKFLRGYAKAAFMDMFVSAKLKSRGDEENDGKSDEEHHRDHKQSFKSFSEKIFTEDEREGREDAEHDAGGDPKPGGL